MGRADRAGDDDPLPDIARFDADSRGCAGRPDRAPLREQVPWAFVEVRVLRVLVVDDKLVGHLAGTQELAPRCTLKEMVDTAASLGVDSDLVVVVADGSGRLR